MNFNFGAARKLYARREHPRIYFGRQDLPRLRRQQRSGDGKKIAAAFRQRAREPVQRILKMDPVKAVVPEFSNAVNTAMLAILDENDDALEATRRLLAAAPAADKNPPANGQARHRLGRISSPLAQAYDLKES